MNHTKKLLFLLALLFVFSFFGLALGSSGIISFSDIFSYLSENESKNELLIQLRLPRTITAIIAGAGISIAGLLMQTLFRNDLAGPSVLGISSGSTLGVAIGIFTMEYIGFSLGNERFTVSFLAILGALLITFLLLLVSKYVKQSNTLLIIGLMVGYFVSSVVNVFSFYADKTNLQSFVYWGLGSFDKEINFLILSYYYYVIIGVIIVVFFLVKPLNLLLIGEKYAVSLGLKVKQTRILIISLTGILVGTITALCGPIAFLGIAIPHLSRNLLKTSNHKHTIIFTIILGAIIALICDIIARLPGIEGTLPLNAVTSFIGAPIVVWIIIKRKIA